MLRCFKKKAYYSDYYGFSKVRLVLQQPLAWLRANMHLPYKVRFGGAKFGRGWGQLMYGSVMLLHAASAALISSCGNLVGHFFLLPMAIPYQHCLL